MSNRSERFGAISLPVLLLLLLISSGWLQAQPDDSSSAPVAVDTSTGGEEGDSVIVVEEEPDFLSTLDSAGLVLLYDSTKVAPRLPSTASIEALRDDDDLRYDVEGHTPETIWDRILSWIGDLLGAALGDPIIARAIEWAFYIVAGLVLIFATWKLITTNHSGLLARGGGDDGVTLGAIEDINAVDFDPLVEKAIRERDFRAATRFLYLKGLRRLSERNLIEWRRDRMNHDYLRQLGRSELADPFARCTLLFEYVWYGDFPVDEKTFGGIAGTLRSFISRVERGA